MNPRIKEFKTILEEEIKSLDLPTEPGNLYDPINYFMGLGGKRLRPILCLLAKALYEQPDEEDVRAAIGLELFHNFTLLHDDIMDEAPLRRGKPTVHSQWDSNVAILAGDALMIKAYQALEGKGQKSLAYFNKIALEVCEGQQFDMDFESRSDVNKEEYLNMIRLKTAVLIGFSLRLGGQLGNASENDLDLLYQIGEEAGVGFQLMDDYLDAFGDPEKFGKKPGGDILAGKKTMLWFLAMENLNEEDKSILEQIYQKEKRTEEDINSVLKLFQSSETNSRLEDLINDRFERSKQILDGIDSDASKKELIWEFLNYLSQRDS